MKKKRTLPQWINDQEKSTSRVVHNESVSKTFSAHSYRSSKAKFAPLDDNEQTQKILEFNKSALKEYFEQICAYSRVVVFDVESSGFTKEDQVIEIGAVEIVNNVRTGNLFCK